MSSEFHTTHWTLVQQSCGDDTASKQALSDLCAAYYEPVVVFLRRHGRDDDEARDLAHEFFARLLAADGAISAADPSKGRFRSYLLGAVKHFAADRFDKSVAAKRGGQQTHVSLDAGSITDPSFSGAAIADENAEEPDRAFDRQWALTLLARALSNVEAEMREEGKMEQFEALKPWLTGDENERQAVTAEKLGVNEGALKVAIHRLRKRFRQAVKTEIAQTSGPDETGGELQYLLSVL